MEGLTPKQAMAMYNELTRENLTNPYLVTSGMQRRGYSIQRDFNGRRITVAESDVRSYVTDKQKLPKLPNRRFPSLYDPSQLTVAQANVLYTELTGKHYVNQRTLIAGMERRGYVVRKNGRNAVAEDDVRAYAESKAKQPRLTKAGQGITLKGSCNNKPKKLKSTLRAMRKVAERQGFEAVQRQGYVELVPSKRYVTREPEFNFDFGGGQ